MGIIRKILILYLVLARFVIELTSPIIAADILAVLISIFLILVYPEKPLLKLVLLISISLFNFDLLQYLGIFRDAGIISTLGAIVTLLIAYTPSYGNTI